MYARISKDKEGRAENIETQHRRATSYAEGLWPGREVRYYSDNDLTAADPDVFRPDYDRLLHDIRAGHVAQIVVAEQSRLTRQPEEWEQLLVVLTRAQIGEVHCYRRGGVVQVAGSKLVGRIMAAVNAEEVEVLKARVLEKMEVTAAEGRPHGGTPFAYTRTVKDGKKNLEPDPDRVHVVTETADRLLAGWSLSAIAADLNERQIPRARGGKRWTASTVRSLVTNPTVAGMRTHRGRLIPGTWTPILDRGTWDSLQHILTAPVVLSTDRGVYRATRARRTARRRYLLTGGIAVCGICGHALCAQQRQQRDRSRVPIYACHPSTGGCSRINILAAPLEDHVARELCRELDRPGFWDAYTADPAERTALLAERATLVERESGLARRFAAGEMDPHEWDAARAVLKERRGDVEAALGRLPASVERLSGVELLERWGLMLLPERRAVVARHVERVVVSPAKKGVRVFDVDRVDITFR